MKATIVQGPASPGHFYVMYMLAPTHCQLLGREGNCDVPAWTVRYPTGVLCASKPVTPTNATNSTAAAVTTTPLPSLKMSELDGGSAEGRVTMLVAIAASFLAVLVGAF